MGRKRRPVPWRVAIQVWINFDGRCHYCDSGPLDPEIAEIDHRVPISKGGSDDIENLALACRPCNRWKSDYDEMDVIFDLRAIPPIWALAWPKRWDWKANKCLG